MTCSYDYKIQLFDLENVKNGPMLKWNFDVGIRDVAWAPYNSMIFAALLTDGQILIYDLSYSKYTPLCTQAVAVTSKSLPEKVRFNNWGPYLLISDRSGCVQTFKLSPNLRKIEKPEQAIGTAAPKAKPGGPSKKKGAPKSGRYPGIDLRTQIAKTERLLTIFRENEPPTLRLGAPMKKYNTISGEPFSTKLPDGTELLLPGAAKEKPKGDEKAAPKKSH